MSGGPRPAKTLGVLDRLGSCSIFFPSGGLTVLFFPGSSASSFSVLGLGFFGRFGVKFLDRSFITCGKDGIY